MTLSPPPPKVVAGSRRRLVPMTTLSEKDIEVSEVGKDTYWKRDYIELIERFVPTSFT